MLYLDKFIKCSYKAGFGFRNNTIFRSKKFKKIFLDPKTFGSKSFKHLLIFVPKCIELNSESGSHWVLGLGLFIKKLI